MINEPDKDFERCKFMEKLIASVSSDDGLLVTDWEDQFLRSYAGTQQYHRWFTPGRRSATDRLWQKYGSMIDLPFIPVPSNGAGQMAEADPTGCEFLVRRQDGQCGSYQCRCNEPAELMRANGFRYCGAHADQVQRDLKRTGKVIHLVKFVANATPGGSR